jgi:hypothetical protein
VAQTLSKALAERGAFGVALTGSLARGDDAPGSDVDLWVIGRHNERIHLVHAGVPVTLLVETVHRAFSLDHLGRVEVQQARVLSDPLDVFRRLQAFHRQHEPRLKRATLEALREEAAALDEASRRGTPVTRLLLAREALHRAVLTELYARHGLRTPKFRHVQRHLGAAFARAYSGAMDYGHRSDGPALRRALRVFVDARQPSAVPAKLAAGALEEAHELARLEVRSALALTGPALRQLRAIGRLASQETGRRRAAVATVFSIPEAGALGDAMEAVAKTRARLATPDAR